MNDGAKTFLRVMNIFIILICAAAVCGYFAMPLWRVMLSVKMTDGLVSALEKTVPESERAILGPALDELRKTETEFTFTADIETKDTIAAVLTGSPEVGRQVILRNVDVFADELLSGLRKVLKPIAVRLLVDQTIDSTVSSIVGKGSGESVDLDEVYEKSGMSDEWIAEKTNEIINAASAGDATVNTVTGTIMKVAEDVVAKLESSPEYAGAAEYFNENKDQIRKEIENRLSQVADSDGHIDSDNIIEDKLLPLLAEAIGNGEITLPEGVSIPGMSLPQNGPTVMKLSSSQPEEEKKEYTADDVSDAVRKLIESKIDEKTVNRVTTALEITGISVLIVFAFWIFLAIKTLIKSFSSKNPGVRVWAPVVFGWPHFTLFFLIPTILFVNGGAFLTAAAPTAGLDSETVRGIMSGIKLSFGTCGMISAICALALLIISLFYGAKRRELKNYYG